ncbi:hypothetical protein [Marinobacter sp. SS13-12]|uniref:hypothetical protein n=1 Tax=Marinobacter sp. SS13-12 TaxID=3050451 RepID=UPI00255229F6|nr:hypothetical protein [Marinobacter sp. SS13-12]MDK8465913.1 hypothetical protein [Marinobacter sp. SS13-12]
MFYTLGFMKCVIAPTLGMALWAWFVTDALLFPSLRINEAAVVGVFLAVPLALGFSVFCHYASGFIRAVGVIAAVLTILLVTPELSADNNPEFMVGSVEVVLPPMIMVIGAGFFGFCFWPVIFPREILATQGGVLRGIVQVTLEDAVNKESKKERNSL